MRNPIPVIANSGRQSHNPDFCLLHACWQIALLCVFTAFLCDLRAIPSWEAKKATSEAPLCDFFAVSCKFRVKIMLFVAKNSKNAHFGRSAAASAVALATTQPRLETLPRQAMLLAIISMTSCFSPLQKLDFQRNMLDQSFPALFSISSVSFLEQQPFSNFLKTGRVNPAPIPRARWPHLGHLGPFLLQFMDHASVSRFFRTLSWKCAGYTSSLLICNGSWVGGKLCSPKE